MIKVPRGAFVAMAAALNDLNLDGLGRRSAEGAMQPAVIADIESASRLAQKTTLDLLRNAIMQDLPAHPLPSPEVALRELLREGAGIYGTVVRGSLAECRQRRSLFEEEPGDRAS